MAAQNEARNGGIINPLFDGLTYNTSRHFAHCSYFSSPLRKNTTQLAKYLRVLYVKPSNKVYIIHNPNFTLRVDVKLTDVFRDAYLPFLVETLRSFRGL